MTAKRTASFQRNTRLEAVLNRLNTALTDIVLPEVSGLPLPPLFVLGPPRSGTTYCMQWLATSGAFSYPTNLIARFWQSPAIGAIVQQMISDPDLDFRGEFSDLQIGTPQTRSELGKTKGLLSPNEFWYLWRSVFPGDGDIGIDLSQATDDQFARFSRKLSEFASVAGKPVATKAMIVNHQVAELANALPEALFLHIDRAPDAAAWSLLGARERMHGDTSAWYSFKTPNFDTLKDLPPDQQVIRQIETIRADLTRQLDGLPRSRWVSMDYADLCSDPAGAFEKLRALYGAHGVSLQGENTQTPSKISSPDIPAEVQKTFEIARRT